MTLANIYFIRKVDQNATLLSLARSHCNEKLDVISGKVPLIVTEVHCPPSRARAYGTLLTFLILLQPMIPSRATFICSAAYSRQIGSSPDSLYLKHFLLTTSLITVVSADA